jgi:GMP synthase-like glutamine amidotransferase
MSILIFEHSDNANAGRLAATLRDYGHRLRILELHHGHRVPPDLDDVHGIVSCGGPQSANDATDYLVEEMRLIRAGHEIAVPIVGLCLGCQLVAKALGGQVERMSGGIELGWLPVTLTDAGREDIVHQGIPWTSSQFHWHREQVAKAPEGAKILAKSDRCPVQAWSLGLRTYGFQYHPEVVPSDIERWMTDEPAALAEARMTREELRLQTARHFDDMARTSSRLFEQIALLLMPVDRLNRGVLRDLQH